jgi:hydrogenase 3 maturation protease
MTYVSQHDFEQRLRRRLKGARRVAVVGIGDELAPHDRLGMLAARELDALHLPNVKVFLAGTVPEAVTGPVRRYKPDHVLLLDAADMGARPGTVALLQSDDIRASLLSTHALPLSVVMEFLAKDAKTKVTLVGIQPNAAHHGDTPCSQEQAGLTRLLVSTFRILGQRSGTKGRALTRGSHAL